MGLLVLNPGLHATIQDRGRPGYREFGVPEGGAFDRSSLDLANALLGNGPDAAAMELTLAGGVYRARGRMGLALAGAPFDARIRSTAGEVVLRTPQSFAMDVGDDLVIGSSSRGARAYLAVAGGWRTRAILGSRSSEARIEAGAFLDASPNTSTARRRVAPECPDPSDGPIRLIDGPDGPIPPTLLDAPYRVLGASDRVGLRLGGPSIEGAERPDRPSSPVAAGAVQVAGGMVMVLGVAGGTMGGYPHVAHVIAADVDRLGQARPGQGLRFVRVGLAEARRIDRARRASLAARDLRAALAARSGDID